MSVTITGRYTGKKFVEMLHGPSGAKLTTDAPRDNQGEGNSYSPTDLLAGALGSCILTIMANLCERSGWLLDGAHFRVEKHMVTTTPRRIGALELEIHLPAAFHPEAREKLERAAKSCPVHHSLHPDIQIDVNYVYDV